MTSWMRTTWIGTNWNEDTQKVKARNHVLKMRHLFSKNMLKCTMRLTIALLSYFVLIDGAHRQTNQKIGTYEYKTMHTHRRAFHYVNKHSLNPKLMAVFGTNKLPQLFVQEFVNALSQFQQLNILSIGSGDCKLESNIFQAVLLMTNVRRINIFCYDPSMDGFTHSLSTSAEVMNKSLQGTGQSLKNSSMMIIPTLMLPEGVQFHGVFAHHALHHVDELEQLFQFLHSNMHDDAIMVIADMVGNNGHSRWPEQLTLAKELWGRMPTPGVAWDYLQNCSITKYPNYAYHICQPEANEGIRSSEVMPFLVKQFQFEKFVGYGGIEFEFIGNRLSQNFDHDTTHGRKFLDDLMQIQDEALINGKIKPDQVIATLRKRSKSSNPPAPPKVWKNLTPEFCVRDHKSPTKAVDITTILDPCKHGSYCA